MSDQLPMPMPGPLTDAQRHMLLNLVRRAARAEILPRFRRLGASEIDQKSGPQDLVTDADREAEKMIARGIARMFPGAVIIGEEASAGRDDFREAIAEAPLGFTIDPVDGTWNFARGISTFGVIVSMTRLGVPVFGLHYDPVLDDAVWAEEHGPCWLTLKHGRKRQVQVSAGGAVPDLSGFAPLYLLPEDKQEDAARAMTRFSRAMNLRCSCHEFRTFATGGVDFVFASRLTPWDHAAGVMLARAAGGHVSLLDGSDYRADKQGILLCAANRDTWERVRDVYSFLLD